MAGGWEVGELPGRPPCALPICKRRKGEKPVYKKLSYVGLVAVAVLLTGCNANSGEVASPNQSSTAVASASPSNTGGPESFADTMFTLMMIPHHQQAVVMGELAQSRAEDPFIRELSARIGQAQSSEIELMRSWLAEWQVSELTDDMLKAHEGHMGMDGMLSEEELASLEQAQGSEFDRLFAEYMIAHHLGAVEMAQNVLTTGSDPRVRAFAEEVIAVQEAEIAEMEGYLASLS